MSPARTPHRPPATELIAVGNTCVDLFIPHHETPKPGGISRIPSFDAVPGGNGANTAVTSARLGVRTALAGVLGDDVFGRYLREFVAEEGVDTSLLELLPGRSSPATLVFNDEHGERSFVHHPGTNTEFFLPRAALECRPEVFHFAAPELLPGLWPAGIETAAKTLRARGVRVSMDLFAVEGDVPAAEVVEAHRRVLRHVDMVFPNEDEARCVTGRSDLHDVMDYFHDLGIRIAVVKRGAEGATISWDGNREEVSTRTVAVLDTCGAGDSFVGGFLAAILRGRRPLEAAEFGCAIGTLCVERRGSLTATGDRDRLSEVLERFDFPGKSTIPKG